jgi:cytochrome c-type biogenesis protein CcmH
MKRWVPLICGMLLLAAGSTPGRAQESELSEAELDQLSAEVAAQLRCPVCRNQSVLESSSGLAREMQSVVRDRLAAGETPEEVRAYFVGRYGDWILLKPEPKGINLLVYLLPAAALLFGGVVLYYRIKRWTGATAPRSEAGPAVLETPDAVVGAIGDAGTEDRVAEPESPGAEGGLSDEEEEWIRRQIGKVG